MRTIAVETISEAVAALCVRANTVLPQEVTDCIRRARSAEPWPAARETLDALLENAACAAPLPICQDTGMACVFAALGQEVRIDGDFAAAVDEGVRRGYARGHLRQSVVRDPLLRGNTGDNTPAVLYTELVPGDRLTLTVAPKGFGSENMSRIAMLMPSDGVDGVARFVVETVALAGPNACPPVVVGVGLGGTFDKCALLAKRALLRPLGAPNDDPFYAVLEARLLDQINALGIGPQGFGGKTTALAVHIETMPTHIAGLPCAVNLNCHAARHATEVL